MTWEIVGVVAAVAGTLLALGALVVAGLERRARIEDGQVEQARAGEAAAQALEAVAAARLAERRADVVIRSIRAGSAVAGEAGVFANRVARPSVRALRRIPDHAPLRAAVTEVSSALDEARVVGPATVVHAMEQYLDAILAVFEAATTGERNALVGVQEAIHVVASSKANLVTAAQEAGIGDSPSDAPARDGRAPIQQP